MENFINENNIILNLETEDKREIINKMTETISEEKLLNKEKFIEDVFKREEMENTVVGFKSGNSSWKIRIYKFTTDSICKIKRGNFFGEILMKR